MLESHGTRLQVHVAVGGDLYTSVATPVWQVAYEFLDKDMLDGA